MSIDLEVASLNFTLFNPAFIDDYGFTPTEFRVFARIMRRSVNDPTGDYESVSKMAKTLAMSENSIRAALRVLVACKALHVTQREGEPHLLTFQTCDQWLPSSQLKEIRRRIVSSKQAQNVLSNHVVLMEYHSKRLGAITDGAGQGKAVKTILAQFSVDDAKGCYEYQMTEMQLQGGWRSSVSWKTVLPFIAEWVKAGRPKAVPPKTNGYHPKPEKELPPMSEVLKTQTLEGLTRPPK